MVAERAEDRELETDGHVELRGHITGVAYKEGKKPQITVDFDMSLADQHAILDIRGIPLVVVFTPEVRQLGLELAPPPITVPDHPFQEERYFPEGSDEPLIKCARCDQAVDKHRPMAGHLFNPKTVTDRQGEIQEVDVCIICDFGQGFHYQPVDHFWDADTVLSHGYLVEKCVHCELPKFTHPNEEASHDADERNPEEETEE